MGDGSLSKEEIDALLMGADDGDADAAADSPARPPAGGGGGFAPKINPAALTSVATALNEAVGEAASAAATMAGKTVKIENAVLDEIDAQTVASQIAAGSVVVESALGAYQTVLAFDRSDADQLVMSMMQSDAPPEVMDEANLSTISELGNTIFSSLSKNLGVRFKDTLTPSTPSAKLLESEADLTPFTGYSVVRITYQFSLGDSTSQIFQYIDAAGPAKWAQSSYAPAAAQGQAPAQQQPAANQNFSIDQSSGSSVNPVNYPSFQAPSGAASQMPANIDLLMDVQMVLTVELGRTKKYVKDIFQLGEGSIIELDKLAGEPVDLLANGKLIAKGEVVVIDENFGVRVTDIVGPAERMARMSEG